MKPTKTETLIQALRILADDIQFDNGVVSAAITEAADRLEAEHAELLEWRDLRAWGGTPEIVHGFIKGQQMRIYEAQDLEKELDEQCRLLGMSSEREAALLAKLEAAKRDRDCLKLMVEERKDWHHPEECEDWLEIKEERDRLKQKVKEMAERLEQNVEDGVK